MNSTLAAAAHLTAALQDCGIDAFDAREGIVAVHIDDSATVTIICYEDDCVAVDVVYSDESGAVTNAEPLLTERATYRDAHKIASIIRAFALI